MKAAVFPILLMAMLQGQTLKNDENVIVFPSYAYEGQDGKVRLSFRAWIFEPEADSVWRQSLVRSVTKFLPTAQTAEEKATLHRRLYGFTLDNERNKTLTLALGKQPIQPGTSASDGHIQAELDLPLGKEAATALATGNLALTWDRAGQQKPIWIAHEGLSVVSDIDDTIKITQVLDRKAMVLNSFLREFQAVAGMPALYQSLAGKSAVFHYVSASPWQLYPDLRDFLEKHFPQGTVSLRSLRWKDASGVEFLWKDSLAYKINTIADLLQKFPRRKFLLVGDSGEKDPEVYEEIRRRFPAQIVGILIRIPPEQKATKRKEGMTYFHDAAEVEAVLKSWGL